MDSKWTHQFWNRVLQGFIVGTMLLMLMVTSLYTEAGGERLVEEIERWRTEIQKDPAFASWEHAKWEKVAMGPNTHQWLITLSLDNKIVGYMVIGIKQSVLLKEEDLPWVLLEYGLGEYPLFSHQLLPKGLQRKDGQITYAYHGLESLFLLQHSPQKKEKKERGTDKKTATIYYLNGKSGEEYPIEWFKRNSYSRYTQPTSQLTSTSQLQEWHAIQGTEMDPFFADPYYSIYWSVESDRVALNSADQIIDLLQEESKPRITYVTQLFNKKLLAPYRVSGYHHWSTGEIFIALEDEGKRYLSYAYLLQLGGSFYMERDQPDLQ